MKTIKIYWKIPLVISVLVALFWTIWYLIAGSVPSSLFFYGNTYHHWIFSRWLDIPTCFISLMLIQTFFIPTWKNTDIKSRDQSEYVILLVVSIIGYAICIVGIIVFVLTFWLNFLFSIIFFLSVELIGIVVIMLAMFIDTICKWFLSTKFYIWLIN